MSNDLDDFLAHYGVLGMHWGKHKAGSVEKSRRGPKEPSTDQAEETKALNTRVKRSGTDALSNTELQTAITRMNLEQQYNRLNPSTKSKGQKVASSILADTGKEVAKDLVKKGIKTGISAGVKAVIK